MNQNSVKYFISNPPMSDYIVVKGKFRVFAKGTCQELINSITKKVGDKTVKDIEHPSSDKYILKV